MANAGANLNQAGLAAIVNAMSEKTPTLSEATARAFRIWRAQFTLVAEARGWNALDAKRKAKCSLREEAAELAIDIQVNDAAQNLEAFLDALQARFIPEAESELARTQFRAAMQGPGESIVIFASRIKNLYQTAYQNRAANFNTEQDLIRGFAMGLANEAVGRNVMNQAPQTFNAATAHAQQFLATEALWQQRGGIRAIQLDGMNDGAVAAVRRQMMASDECYNCGRRGHFARECPRGGQGRGRSGNFGSVYKPYRGQGAGRGGRGRSRSRMRSSRSSYFSSASRQRDSRPAVRQLSAAAEPSASDDDYAADLLADLVPQQAKNEQGRD